MYLARGDFKTLTRRGTMMVQIVAVIQNSTKVLVTDTNYNTCCGHIAGPISEAGFVKVALSKNTWKDAT